MTHPLMRSNEETPIGRPCKMSRAEAGEPCTTVLGANGVYVRVLHYFHAVRWRDYNQSISDAAALSEWQKTHGGKTA